MENIVFYGTRGSSSLTSGKYIEFGGGTSCILLNFGSTHIMVDCGSGVNNALDDIKDFDELHLFISHGHLDHICGIPILFNAMKDKRIHVWGKTFGGASIESTVGRIMDRSLWPVSMSDYKNVSFHEISDDVTVGDVLVRNTDSNHPGGCSLFRFDYKDESVVTAFDFCHLDYFADKLCRFAEGCTTLIYDGFMTEEDLAGNTDWGHSTPEAGGRLGARIGAKSVIITHFGPYDDDFLSDWETQIRRSYPNVRFARSGRRRDELGKMIEIGGKLSAESNTDSLLLEIVDAGMDITGADGGTLYLLEDGKLDFKVFVNRSRNTRVVRRSVPLGIPFVDINAKNICSACARGKELINVPDCYADTEYDFSGVQDYDSRNGYHTQSVIAIPLADEYRDIVGVLQLINAQDSSGRIIPFRKQDEGILTALANQASMAIKNTSYREQINELLYGFIRLLSVGVDCHSQYNDDHAQNMVKFAEKFFDYEAENSGKYTAEGWERREILMSILLHDIGKILTPSEILNKDSRLGKLTDTVKARFERRKLLLKLFLAEHKITEAEYTAQEAKLRQQADLIDCINKADVLTDKLRAGVEKLSKATYEELDGTQCPVITESESECLYVVSGNLTAGERAIMENHVVMTQKLLSQLEFPKHYDKIPLYAGSHHEYLNGTGYPDHLTADDLPWPCRLITVIDIFEALISRDEPYKKLMSVEKAFYLMRNMVKAGQLDADIVDEFEKSGAWKE